MPFPRILTEYCKGCRLCVEACPKDVLEISDQVSPLGVNPAVPVRPEDCIGCLACYVVCPDAAVEVYVEKKKQPAKARA
jgi:2-oxoglutarate ferredoxin oxidoreductase subunit delta